jgi:hypothetical protein
MATMPRNTILAHLSYWTCTRTRTALSLPRNYAMEPPVHGMTAVRSGALAGPRQYWIELVLTTSDF